MESLFSQSTAQGVISRLQKLQPQIQPLWGKMNAAQMLAHCNVAFQMYFGEKKIKRVWLGYLFGSMIKKKILSDKPWSKSLPTPNELVVADERHFEEEKEQLVQWISRFVQEARRIPPPEHPFFGKMTHDEWGLHAYKHTDHHLRQFGV